MSPEYYRLSYSNQVNWDFVRDWSRSTRIPIPPAAKLPQDSGYYGQKYGTSPTTGITNFAYIQDRMRKEAEQAAALQRMADQQKSTNDKYMVLLEQYQQLLTSFIAEKKAHETETETIRTLKKQMKDIAKILKDVGLM